VCAFILLPRRDLLDISPVLTEAAGAIVDVSASGISTVLLLVCFGLGGAVLAQDIPRFMICKV
jgi:hypothetical protein